MNKKTLTALKESILIWEMREKGSVVDEEEPLCVLFHSDEECTKCPIFKHTGKEGCINTPYNDWEEHSKNCFVMDDIENACVSYDNCDEGANGACRTYMRLAGKELAFLKSLLPEEEE